MGLGDGVGKKTASAECMHWIIMLNHCFSHVRLNSWEFAVRCNGFFFRLYVKYYTPHTHIHVDYFRGTIVEPLNLTFANTLLLLVFIVIRSSFQNFLMEKDEKT